MKQATLWSMALFALLVFGSYVHAHSNSFSDEYLRIPDEKASAALEKTVAASREPCGSSTKPSEEQEYLLFELIRDGNPSALRAALAVSKCFGAADGEDFFRSAGALFEMRPLVFL